MLTKIYYLYSAPQNASLWREYIKTLYDPCPAGWRVPLNYDDDRSPWHAFTSDNGPESGDRDSKGRTFSGVGQGGSMWYPYSGRRGISGGFLDIVATYSQIWSATATGTSATSTSFYTPLVLQAYTFHGRSYGFPVRCVRE